MKDPQRLSDQADLPEALYEALRGLGQHAPPPDAVARIQRSLSALPVPPGPEGGALIAKSGWSASAFKAAAVAVGAVAAALVVTVTTRAPEPVPRAAKVKVAAPAAADTLPLTANDRFVPLPAAAVPATAPQPSAPKIESAHSQRRSVREPVPQQERSQRWNERRANGAAELPEAVEATAEAAPPTAPASTAPTESARVDAPAVAPQARETRASAADSPKPKQLPVPEDEASLLYRAKKAARTDLHAALRMLEQHATHFPHGTLVEEREVLAIDLLRRIGRGPEAKQRSVQFLQEFPHSSYRSAITR